MHTNTYTEQETHTEFKSIKILLIKKYLPVQTKLIKFQPEKLESEALGSPKAKAGKESMKTNSLEN